MTKIPSTLIAVALSATSGTALAQDQSAQAEELSREGKTLFADNKLEQALEKFRQATVLSPNGKYYFNVCFTLAQLGRTGEAITACEAVEPNGANDKLKEKTRRVLQSLRDKLADEQPAPEAPIATDPTQPATNEPEVPAVSTPLVAAPAPRHSYEWAIGLDIAGMQNLGIGGDTASGDERYESGGASFRVYADWLFQKALRLGGRGYIGYTSLPAAAMGGDDISLIDFGAGGLMHFPISSSLYVTPYLGAVVSIQGPQESPEAFIAAGLRGEAALSWVIDDAGKHVVGMFLAVTGYTGAIGDDSGGNSPEFLGIDGPGASFNVGFGYTRRFSTPLGQLPWMKLE